jgi:hypothetical protein
VLVVAAATERETRSVGRAGRAVLFLLKEGSEGVIVVVVLVVVMCNLFLYI